MYRHRVKKFRQTIGFRTIQMLIFKDCKAKSSRNLLDKRKMCRRENRRENVIINDLKYFVSDVGSLVKMSLYLEVILVEQREKNNLPFFCELMNI